MKMMYEIGSKVGRLSVDLCSRRAIVLLLNNDDVDYCFFNRVLSLLLGRHAHSKCRARATSSVPRFADRT